MYFKQTLWRQHLKAPSSKTIMSLWLRTINSPFSYCDRHHEYMWLSQQLWRHTVQATQLSKLPFIISWENSFLARVLCKHNIKKFQNNLTIPADPEYHSNLNYFFISTRPWVGFHLMMEGPFQISKYILSNRQWTILNTKHCQSQIKNKSEGEELFIKNKMPWIKVVSVI